MVDFLKTTPAVILGFWAVDFLLLKLSLPKTLGLGSLVIAIVYYPRLTIDVVRVLSRTPKSVIAAATALGAPPTTFIRRITTRDLFKPLARATAYNFIRAAGDITVFICLGAYVTVSISPIEPASPLHVLSVQIFHWSYRHYAGLATILSLVCAGFILVAGLSALWTGPMMNVKSTTKARTQNMPEHMRENPKMNNKEPPQISGSSAGIVMFKSWIMSHYRFQNQLCRSWTKRMWENHAYPLFKSDAELNPEVAAQGEVVFEGENI